MHDLHMYIHACMHAYLVSTYTRTYVYTCMHAPTYMHMYVTMHGM